MIIAARVAEEDAYSKMKLRSLLRGSGVDFEIWRLIA